jgi:hypothetical protein
VTAAELQPGDLFRLPPQRTRFVMKAHREGTSGSRWVDAIELDHYGQQRCSRCFDPGREVVLVRRVAA